MRKKKQFRVDMRDRTKETEFSFAWSTSDNKRTAKVTGSNSTSEFVTAICPISIVKKNGVTFSYFYENSEFAIFLTTSDSLWLF
jgi:hypothetical protein